MINESLIKDDPTLNCTLFKSLSKSISIISLFQWIIKCIYDYSVLLIVFNYFCNNIT